MKEYIKLIIVVSCGALLGAIIPVFFIFLDLKELYLPFNFPNAIDVAKSQLIYPFSFFLFPILFGTSSFLFMIVLNERDQSKKHGEYVTAILNGISDPVLVCSHVGTILYSNERFKSLFQSHLVTKVSQIREGLFSDLLHSDVIQEITLTHDHQKQVFIVKCSRLEIRDYRYVLAFNDITHLREQQALIEHQKNKLNEAAKLSALGEMASGFAHEINNPLTIISGQLSLLVRDIKNGTPNIEKSLQRVDVGFKTVERISKIIQALRNLARDSQETKLEACVISNIIEDVVSLSRMKLSGKDIEFVSELNGLDERTVFGDRIQLGQVLVNLINNAVDAVESIPSAWIKLIVSEQEDSFIFKIVDSGQGVQSDLRSKIFEPMFTTKLIGKGTGLGLSLSRSIIEKHKGILELDTDAPNTTFVIRLPKS